MLSNSSVTAVKVAIGGGGPKGELQPGLSVELPQDKHFKYLLFENQIGSQITIEIALSTGRVYDNRFVVSGVIAIDDTANSIETPAKITLVVGNSYTATISAGSTRKELILQNTGTNEFWYGDINVDPVNKRGIRMQAGDIHILTLTGAVTLKSNSLDCEISTAYLKKT
jgi:hypothetical protein